MPKASDGAPNAPETPPVEAPEAPASDGAPNAPEVIEEPAVEPVEPVVTDGMIKARNADGTGCSFRGVSYDADEEGVVTVPMAAIGELVALGFRYAGA